MASLRARLGCVAVLLTATASAAAATPAHGLVQLEVVGTRADLVSGGDVLVRTDGTLTADGRVVPVHEGLALVTGLRARTVLEARRGAAGARLVVLDHPRGGPVLSGPQVQPWTCTTAQLGLARPL